MSKKRGTQHLRQRRRRPHLDVLTCTRMAVTDGEEGVDEAKRMTHDSLIAELGERRRSGIQWTVLPNKDPKTWKLIGDTDRHSVHTEHVAPPTSTSVEVVVQPGNVAEQRAATVEYIREHPEGWTVIDMCDAVVR